MNSEQFSEIMQRVDVIVFVILVLGCAQAVKIFVKDIL